MFTTNGIACTTATVIAAALGITDLDQIDDVDRIRRAHLLLAMFNALQPGVFALSGWDLCGMLTLPPTGCRGAARGRRHSLDPSGRARSDGGQPAATRSHGRNAGGRSLYGSIPDQLADETSFLRQLQAILRVRSHYGIATSRQVDIPEVSHRGMLVLVHQLDDPGQLSTDRAELRQRGHRRDGAFRAPSAGSQVSDMFTGKTIGPVDDLHSFAVEMPAHHGMSLLVEAPEPDFVN